MMITNPWVRAYCWHWFEEEREDWQMILEDGTRVQLLFCPSCYNVRGKDE